MAHKTNYDNQVDKQAFTKTSNTKGRSTVRTNTRKASYRNPARKKKQKLVTIMSGGY
jgi:hypothetical protein